MSGAPVRSVLRPRVLDALRADPQPLVDLCAAVGRDARDRSIRRVLDELASDGMAQRSEDGWRRMTGGRPLTDDAPVGEREPGLPPPGDDDAVRLLDAAREGHGSTARELDAPAAGEGEAMHALAEMHAADARDLAALREMHAVGACDLARIGEAEADAARALAELNRRDAEALKALREGEGSP